jgi:hypothetical protein
MRGFAGVFSLLYYNIHIYILNILDLRAGYGTSPAVPRKVLQVLDITLEGLRGTLHCTLPPSLEVWMLSMVHLHTLACPSDLILASLLPQIGRPLMPCRRRPSFTTSMGSFDFEGASSRSPARRS